MNYILNIINKKEEFKNPPIWIMRQAGRYLPEYRELRSKYKDFLDLCYNPQIACEITLQPIRRFDFDAAIIFSDILVIPQALGCDLEFISGFGPKLSTITSEKDLTKLKIDNIENFLKPVFEAVNLTRSNLDKSKSLIGFAGCPWTLACYMIEGGSSKNFDKVKKISLNNKEFFQKLINILTDSIIKYLSLKIEAGANIIKIFDSWAGIISANEIKKWVIDPNKIIVDELKKRYPQIPIICFPKGIGVNYLNFIDEVNCDCLAIDQTIDVCWAKNNLQNKSKLLQGNLDNYILAFGSKDHIKQEVDNILSNLGSKPFIFNLGHGILPQTPIENVEFLLKLIRK